MEPWCALFVALMFIAFCICMLVVSVIRGFKELAAKLETLFGMPKKERP